MKVVFEGNIGAGKTTFMKYLSTKFTNAKFMYEPDYDELVKPKGKPGILTEYYKGKHGFAMEMLALFTRAEYKCEENQHLFVDRGLDGHRMFANIQYHDGKLNEYDYNIVRRYHGLFKARNPADVYILIHTPAEICYDRIQRRGREYEKNIHEGYLNKIADQLNLWYLFNDDVYFIDGTQSNEDMYKELLVILSDINQSASN